MCGTCIVTIVEKIYNNIEQRHLAALIIIRH
jgi:ferredoxin